MPNVFFNYFSSNKSDLRFLFNNIIVFFLSNVGNFFQFLFQIFSARYYLPNDLSLFASINSLNLIISAPILIVPLLIVRLFEEKKDKSSIIKFLLILIFIFTFIVILISFLLNPFIKDLLEVDKQKYLNYGYLSIIFSFIISCCFGFLQGLKKYTSFGLLHAFSLFVKFLILFLFYEKFNEVDLLFLSTIYGIILSFLFFLILARNEIQLNLNLNFKFIDMYKTFFQFSYIYLFTSIIFVFMSNIDISLSRILLNNYDSGIYTVASTFSKIPLYLTLALLYVLFPEIKKGEKNYKVLLTSISFIFSINFVLIICFYILGDFIISYLYGNRYLEVIKYVLILLPSFTLLNISNIMMIYFTKNHKSIHLLLFLIYSLPFMFFTFRYVDNLLNLSYFIFLFNLIFFIINLTLYFTTNRK